MVYHENNQVLCLCCQPHGYIRMVQSMIERCLLFHMTRDDCIHALAKHASIQPIVTLTVWKELMKENRSFFQAYNSSHALALRQHQLQKKHGRMLNRRKN